MLPAELWADFSFLCAGSDCLKIIQGLPKNNSGDRSLAKREAVIDLRNEKVSLANLFEHGGGRTARLKGTIGGSSRSAQPDLARLVPWAGEAALCHLCSFGSEGAPLRSAITRRSSVRHKTFTSFRSLSSSSLIAASRLLCTIPKMAIAKLPR